MLFFFSWYASLILFVYCRFFLPFLLCYGFSLDCSFFDLPVEVYHRWCMSSLKLAFYWSWPSFTFLVGEISNGIVMWWWLQLLSLNGFTPLCWSNKTIIKPFGSLLKHLLFWFMFVWFLHLLIHTVYLLYCSLNLFMNKASLASVNSSAVTPFKNQVWFCCLTWA